MADGDRTKLPSLQTYTIRDAAKIAHLPERLDIGGLETSLAAQGQVAEELGEPAP
ncbi:hypothetical protein [Paracoccus aminophilus]|uniref:hypothetical protein n=1 Tax=Paracoccus aminophilus TaxID=34003 RepID=UPI00130EF469|nr:hypothetical protein [Paracoccus aminophilus]